MVPGHAAVMLDIRLSSVQIDRFPTSWRDKPAIPAVPSALDRLCQALKQRVYLAHAVASRSIWDMLPYLGRAPWA